jgi:hypothetical protein
MSDIEQIPVTMTVNGKKVQRFVEPRTLLIHFLREDLDITGPHIGCETSHCGACTIDMNGMSVKACTVFAAQANGAELTTVEAMANADGTSSALQEGFPPDARSAVRLLHAGHDHAGPCALEGEPQPDRGRDAHGDLRQLVPLHRLPEHRQGHPVRRGEAERNRVSGGCRMNDMTPTREQREAALKAWAASASALKTFASPRARASMSTTSSCREWCSVISSARLIRTPASPRSTRPKR